MRRQTFITAQPGNDRPLNLDTTSAGGYQNKTA